MLRRNSSNRSNKKQDDNVKEIMSKDSSSSSALTHEEEEIQRRRKMQEEPVSLGVQQEPEPAESVPAAAAATTRPASTFENRIEQEFHNAMEAEIKKGVQAIYGRFTRMLSQEPNPLVHATDALGHDTDFYENLVDAVQSGDPSAGKTTEEVYLKLYNLAFTGMRSLEALKQEYSITSSS